MPKSNKNNSHRICEICGIQEVRLGNSRFFATFPKDEVRCREWVRVTGKEDLVHVPIEKLFRNRYVCGDHFEEKYFNKKGNRLSRQAVPTQNLTSVPLNKDQMSDFPQHVFSCQVSLKQSSTLASRKQDTINNTRSPLSEIQVTDEEDREPAIHEDVICDNCSGQIIGFRYKCVTCDNYDLCQKCEMLESHSDHYMLRIPKSLKFEIAGNFIVKLREILKSDQTLQELVKRTDKASKSVKENVKNDDKAIDLTENVKKTIQREVDRALKSVKMRKKNKENRKRHVTETKDDTSSKKQRTNEENVIVQVDKIEDDENIEGERAIEHAPELVFADVNETELSLNLVKAEVCSTGPHPETQDNLRTFYLKTDIDLSQFMIQVVPSSENPS